MVFGRLRSKRIWTRSAIALLILTVILVTIWQAVDAYREHQQRLEIAASLEPWNGEVPDARRLLVEAT